MNHQHNNSWVELSEYPFKSHYFKTDYGQMHYVDEGIGPIILFVHGTPTWSFLYRNQIKSLTKFHRCIAIDHLGFGLSDKPLDFEGTPELHAKNLQAFIEYLDLKDITLVVHDFGGPIGLGAAIQIPERISRIAVLNTWLWETKKNKDAIKIDNIVRSFIGRFLYRRLNFSPKVLLKQGFSDKEKLTKSLHQQYLSPFPTPESRNGLLKIAEALVGSSDWYQEQWENLDRLEHLPWLFIWGLKDRFITPDYLDKWTQRLSRAQVIELPAGHFVQEEASHEVTSFIEEFLPVKLSELKIHATVG